MKYRPSRGTAGALATPRAVIPLDFCETLHKHRPVEGRWGQTGLRTGRSGAAVPVFMHRCLLNLAFYTFIGSIFIGVSCLIVGRFRAKQKPAPPVTNPRSSGDLFGKLLISFPSVPGSEICFLPGIEVKV